MYLIKSNIQKTIFYKILFGKPNKIEKVYLFSEVINLSNYYC